MPGQRPARQPRQTAVTPDYVAALTQGLDSTLSQRRHRRRPLLHSLLLAAVTVTVLLSACAIDPVRDAQRVLETVPPAALAEARALEKNGQYRAAAEAYLALAKTAPAPARQQLELEAADALLQAGDAEAAAGTLRDLDREVLTTSQREMTLLLQAEVALSRGRAREAMNTLDQVRKGSLPPPLRVKYLGSLAAAYRMNSQPLRAAETLNELDPLLSDEPAARMDNQVSLLFTLASMNKASLAQAARSTGGQMRGWVELAQLLAGRSVASPQLNLSLRQWRERYRQHPALAGLETAYFATLAGGYVAGTDALVLLPTFGQFGAAGGAVRDGIMAAYEADRSGTRPQLSFGADSASAYSEGVVKGADLVIGPLQKASVNALARQGSLSVPTLALNRSEGARATNLFQFSLAPEDEAESAATYAYAAGLRRAALVSPQNPWGRRMADAFRNQWRALGGTLVIQPTYGSVREVAETVTDVDVDVVLLVATSKNIRHLWGALRSLHFDAPVITTSHVYSGDFNPARDQELAGLYFVDIPWLLDQERSDSLSRQALRGTLSNVSGPLARLYAMGIDAYRLAPRVVAMGRQPGTFFPGETGGLTIDARGQVHRQLALAQ
ncbi:penicillin-binding protein activator, partial [Halochromatium sp.]